MKRIPLFFIIVLSILMQACIDDFDDPTLPFTRNDYLGTWNVNESCSRENYSVQIVEDPTSENQVLIKNFALIGYSTTAPYAIIDDDLISLPNQTSGGLQMSGTGSMGNNQMVWSYTIFDGADQFTCSATFTR